MSSGVARVAELTPAVTELRDRYADLETRYRPSDGYSPDAVATRARITAAAGRARRYLERLEQVQADLLQATLDHHRTHDTRPTPGAPE